MIKTHYTKSSKNKILKRLITEIFPNLEKDEIICRHQEARKGP